MPMIGDIIAVAKELRDLKKNFTSAKQEKRNNISVYFQSISDCLMDTYESLSRGDYPYHRCEELRTYAEMLPRTLGDTIQEEKAKELSNKLNRSHEVELLHAQLSTDAVLRVDLKHIAEAAGILKALSVSVKTGLDI